MKPNAVSNALTALLVSGICGCVPGYNSMLFYTKTNAGLVVDTQPPEVDLDIGRQEGLLSPSYEAGKTPPVMASFRFDSEGFFSNYLGSAFATGDAAVTMARLYSAPDWPEAAGERAWTVTKDRWEEKERDFDSAIALYEDPKMPWFVPKEEPGAVRPVLFGTDTSFGFKLAWKNPASPYPDYFRLGYQRRELAVAAVTIGQARDADGEFLDHLEARVPSLLATVDASVKLREPWKSGFEYLQYFASGRAATALAMRRDVRGAMLRRLDPESAKGLDQDIRSFNEDPVADEPREGINAWLGDPSDPTRPVRENQLADWMIQRYGEAPGLTVWLYTYAVEDLEAAITELNIP